jgi:two-component system chemotaxis response regulator CheB
LIVSASFNRGELFDTYQALAAGAVDVLDKPGDDDDTWEQRFLSAVRMVAKIRVITHPRGRLGGFGRARGPAPPPPPPVVAAAGSPSRPEVVALGASTGGPGALADVIAAIPASLSPPILVVLHIGAPFAAGFATWLGEQTARRVRVAGDGDPIDAFAGQVLFAPAGYHLVVEGRRVRLTSEPARHHCRPSIDTLFESIATAYGDRAAACLLTGMGRDGAAGLLAIRRAGGITIAQDEATSIVYGMPREAAELGAAQHVLPLQEIGPMIAQLVGRATEAPR